MLDPDNSICEDEHKPFARLSALPNPQSVNDRLYVKAGGSITVRPAVLCLAFIVFLLALFSYPQSLNWGKWESRIEPNATNSNGATAGLHSLATATPHNVTKSGCRASIGVTHANDPKIEPSHLTADDLALGFDKARWRMSINDAKRLWPLEENATHVVPELDGPHLHPIHEEATLSLEHYVYAGCAFSVKFNFEDKKLFGVHMEADGNDNFKSCHAEVSAELTRQYGEEPLSPFRGYSLHGEWIGPSTDVVYNELQNAVIEIIFSSSG